MSALEPLIILLIEDDPADQELIRNSLKNQKIANEVVVVCSGEEGLDYLHNRGKFAACASTPDIILLDLNMPGMGGEAFLRTIKDDDRIKHIPVIILTASNSEPDIIESYKLQASGYVTKPVDLKEFTEVMAGIEAYWFLLCKRPLRR